MGVPRKPDLKPGERPYDCGVTVLNLEIPHKKSFQTKYRVMYDCCGKIKVVARSVLADKGRLGRKTCEKCAAAAKKYNVTPYEGVIDNLVGYGSNDNYCIKRPDWPVPRQELIGRNVPFYDRVITCLNTSR